MVDQVQQEPPSAALPQVGEIDTAPGKVGFDVGPVAFQGGYEALPSPRFIRP